MRKEVSGRKFVIDIDQAGWCRYFRAQAITLSSLMWTRQSAMQAVGESFLCPCKAEKMAGKVLLSCCCILEPCFKWCSRGEFFMGQGLAWLEGWKVGWWVGGMLCHSHASLTKMHSSAIRHTYKRAQRHRHKQDKVMHKHTQYQNTQTQKKKLSQIQ